MEVAGSTSRVIIIIIIIIIVIIIIAIVVVVVFITDRVGRGRSSNQQRSSVRPSVFLFVRLYPLYLLNRLTFERVFVCWVITIVRLRLKSRSQVKVRGQRGRFDLDPRSRTFLVFKLFAPQIFGWSTPCHQNAFTAA